MLFWAHVSVTTGARHDKVARQTTAVSTVPPPASCIYAESSPVEEEDEANTVLEALSVVLCALLEAVTC